jgi:hypothetical protein
MNGVRERLKRSREVPLPTRLSRAWTTLTLPATVFYLLFNPRIHAAYELTWPRKFRLALRMWRTTRKVFTGTSYKAHLAIAAKLLEIPPSV